MTEEFNPKLQKLKQMQSLPLEQKIIVSKQRIKQWLEAWEDQCVVSFSGGVDSTVLLDLVRSVNPDIKAVFVNTGLEYPQIVKFVKTISNVDIIRPKITYKQVIEKYGYPFPSKHIAECVSEIKHTKSESLKNLRLTGIRPNGEYSPKSKLSKKWKYLIDAPFDVSAKCCDVIKKQPLNKYNNENNTKPFVGVMAEESSNRTISYVKHSCNAFNATHPQSRPLMFWSKQDVIRYIQINNLPYCNSVYGDIVELDNGKLKFSKTDRTGCVFCMFGVHFDQEPNRFQIMQKENPKMYRYCMEELKIKQVLEYCGIPYEWRDVPQQDRIEFEFEFEE